MAIVQLDKVTLFGTLAQKDAVLDGLQRLGCVHLLDLDPSRGPEPETMKSSEAREALNYLWACPVRRKPAKRRKGYDLVEVKTRTLEIKHRQQELDDERDHLLEAIRKLEPWGDFELPEGGRLGPVRFWFHVLPLRDLQTLHAMDLTWYKASEDTQSAYIVVLSPEMPEGLPPPTELDPRSLSRLRARLEEVEEELDDLLWERADLTRWQKFLAQDLNEADDLAARQAAARETLDAENLFAVQGWAPRAARDDLRDFAAQNRLALTIEEPTAEDAPPTLLRNPERLAGGEGAVTFYITPGYHAWDPSLVVFFSFSLFFGMIFSDAGYGLILLLILLALWKKLGSSREKMRFRNLFASLVAATIGYGIVVGSYFGLGPPENTPLASLKMLEVTDRDTMMAIAVVIGVAHLCLANLVTAWRLRAAPRALASLGWTAMLAGGLLVGGAMTESLDPGWAESSGMYLIIGGAGAVFLFSSARPLLSGSIGNWLGRILDGLSALTGVSKAFGDVLSYLRLFALGLASAQLASTFNDLASGAASDVRGAGILLAILILAVGHGINFLLGIMGGVVHGLRLNCIEFFNWSLTEEGYPFQAFCKKAGL